MMMAPFGLIHIIPAHEIEAMEAEIGMALILGGLDPQGIRLEQAAIDYKLRDLEDAALSLNIAVISRAWTTTIDGDLEVAMGFEKESDAVVLKLAI